MWGNVEKNAVSYIHSARKKSLTSDSQLSEPCTKCVEYWTIVFSEIQVMYNTVNFRLVVQEGIIEL